MVSFGRTSSSHRRRSVRHAALWRIRREAAALRRIVGCSRKASQLSAHTPHAIAAERNVPGSRKGSEVGFVLVPPVPL